MWISEVKYQDPRTQTFLGSPSIVRTPDGMLLASHDYFGPRSPHNMENEENLSSVYRSEDEGRTWFRLGHLSGQYWSSLFVHKGATYILGTTAQYGHVAIRGSRDNGFTWTYPTDAAHGLLFRGGVYHDPPNYHCAPVPVLHAHGRVWRSVEDDAAQDHYRDFLAGVISAPEDADLLDGGAWTLTNKLKLDHKALPQYADNATWLEGNMVEAPDGQLWNILRFNSHIDGLNKAAMVRVSADGKTQRFDPRTGIVELPGGASKFTIRRDPRTGIYWNLVNDMEDQPRRVVRNRLSLFSSEDLHTWTKRRTLLEDNLESDPDKSAQNTGFQYVDWQFDGEDILYLVRTAYDGAHNFHDANRITFSRVAEFRVLTAEAAE